MTEARSWCARLPAAFTHFLLPELPACPSRRSSEKDEAQAREKEREEVYGSPYGPAGPYRAIARADDRFLRDVAIHGDPRRSTARVTYRVTLISRATD